MPQPYSFIDKKNNRLSIFDKLGNIVPREKFPSLVVRFTGSNSNVSIVNPMRINKCNIICGNKCDISLGDSCDIVGSLNIFATAEASIVTIGQRCSFSGVDIRMQSEPNLSISIGKQCLFSSNITIRSSDSHTVFDLETKKAINIPTAITLGDHIWVGFGVDIMKNSVIANNCVVAARALVSDRFTQEHCVLAGIPAKVIKTGINWNWENTHNYTKKFLS